jgi:hypothetical protein
MLFNSEVIASLAASSFFISYGEKASVQKREPSSKAKLVCRNRHRIMKNAE